MALPALIFLGGLSAIIVHLCVKVLFALGIGYVTFNGVNTLMDYARNQLQSYIGALPPEMLQIVGLMNIDIYINMVISAMVIKLGFKGVTAAGVLTAWSFTQPSAEV